MKIDFKSPSESDSLFPALAVLAGWVIKTVLHLALPGNAVLVPLGTFIVIAFNLFALVVVISYLRNNKGAEFFRAIIALVAVGIVTSLIEWALFK